MGRAVARAKLALREHQHDLADRLIDQYRLAIAGRDPVPLIETAEARHLRRACRAVGTGIMIKVIEAEPVGSDDWPLWRKLRRAALADAPGAFGSTLSGWSGAGDTEPRWRARLADVPYNVILRLVQKPVGMVSATAPDPEGAIELMSLWVAPEARGQGVGDAAVDQVTTWAARHPGSYLHLSVKVGNEPAIRLYRRHGFVDAGVSPQEPDERIMRR